MSDHGCESCSMPIESGPLCEYCAADDGHLHPFAETFERFIQWTTSREPGISREAAEEKTEDFMSGMPAWSGNGELAERISRRG